MLDEYRERRDQLHAVADRRPADPLRRSRPARSTCSSTSATCCRRRGFATSAEFAEALLRGVARRGHAGRSVRRAGLHPHLVRDVDGQPARGQPAAARVRRDAHATRPRRTSSDRRSRDRCCHDARRSSPSSARRTIAASSATAPCARFSSRATRSSRSTRTRREVEGLKAYASVLDVPGAIDMASFYVPPEIGEQVIDEVARKQISGSLAESRAPKATR